jgi:two-component system sensor histidine kinase KdpD
VKDTVTTPRSNAERHRAVISTHRLGVVRFGLIISWALLAGFFAAALRTDVLSETAVWVPLVALAMAAVVVTLAPWRRALEGRGADILMVFWAAALVGGLIASNEVRSDPPLVAAFAGVVVLSAAELLAPGFLLVVSGMAIGGYLLAVAESPYSPSFASLATDVGTLGFVAALAVVLSLSLRRHLVATGRRFDELRDRQDELTAREADLTQLYSVSRTIGAGMSIDEVLPEMVSRVANSVGAKVGVVLFYSPDEQGLEVMSPIWVSGHALRAEGYRLALTEPGLAQRVFISSDPRAVNDVSELEGDPLLADLVAHDAAAVPLRLEAHTIGVLLVTDKRDGTFSQDDLDLLESLATPAALILNHLTRFQEARETGQRMAELARLKTDFVSVVSHELRTPLTSIIGALATLARPELAPDHPDALRLLGSARRQADRLKGLIEDLLVVSRIDNRALPVRPEPVNLAAFMKETVQSLPEAGALVRLDVPAELPTVHTDQEHLSRVIINVLDNALKHAPGSPIDVAARLSGHDVLISIADHGPGIPYELHDHVFERFTQVAQHETRQLGGTGLGLSIVRGLAEALGGRVWFEPTIGGGATFVVALPSAGLQYTSSAG